MKKINFGNIDRFILFGGGKFILYAAQKLLKHGYRVVIFSANRHLEEQIDGKLFEKLLQESSIIYHNSENINIDNKVLENISDTTIGLSLGAAWIFKKDFIDRFKERLINMHGTRLPQNRGGGNFSWMALSRNRLGFCLIHQIDSGIDTGNIIKYKEFTYPHSCRIPKDFMEHYYQQNILFFDEFLSEIKQKKDFVCIGQPEYLSTYWPRLNTYRHAFIDWNWNLSQIECFINAFDDPYMGASTFLSGKRVFLKDCYADFSDGTFHPFQTGIVYRKSGGALFVAAGDSSLIIKKVFTEDGQNSTDSIMIGERFFTPIKYLEDAKLFKAIYTPHGLKESK